MMTAPGASPSVRVLESGLVCCCFAAAACNDKCPVTGAKLSDMTPELFTSVC